MTEINEITSITEITVPTGMAAHLVADDITYKAGYRLRCEIDQKDPQGRLFYQVECHRPDALTGVMGIGHGGKAYLSEHMTMSELVRKAMSLFLAYEEHECREFFRWRGAQVFGPHISIEALASIADQVDTRP